jgi:outer membrane immunogenic protein
MGAKLGSTQLAILAGMLVVGGIAPGHAADLGNSAQPAAHAEADVNWTGAYVGVEGGLGLGEDMRTYTTNDSQRVDDLKGGVIGINASLLRQTGHFVLGLEANADHANLSGTHSEANGYDYTAKLDGLESMRGVLGLSSGRWLAYGTAGVGFEQVSELATYVSTGTAYSTAQRTKAGWVVGGGVEAMISDRITLGAQYLHYGFNSDNLDEINQITGASVANANYRQSADVIEARLGFKLNGTPDHAPMK